MMRKRIGHISGGFLNQCSLVFLAVLQDSIKLFYKEWQKVRYNGPGQATKTKQGSGLHIEMATVNWWRGVGDDGDGSSANG